MAYLNIFLKDEKGSTNQLPYPTSLTTPVFCWEIPSGIIQVAFCLELKSRKETVLSNGTPGYAYYNSSIITSPTPEHKIPFEMFYNVWSGIVEVRIRIYNEKQEVVYSTHEEADVSYPFETIPQGRRWDSTFDGYYLLLDKEVEQITGTVSPLFQWRNVEDPDNGQNISYQFQWSKTPLFLDGVQGQLGLSGTHTVETKKNSGLNTTFNTVIDTKGALFYRVRAYDGLDYGEWSEVNAFLFSPSSAPHCYFNFVETNCTTDDPNVNLRQNGEIEVSFKIVDTDSPIVSAYLLYKIDEVEYPCSLKGSTVLIPSNEDITVTWLSARQLPNTQTYVYLYLYAFDGLSESEKIIWQYPVFVNNKGIGFGYSDSTNDKLNYRMNGGRGIRSYESYIQIPEEKSIQNDDGTYSPAPWVGEYDEWSWYFNWENYWHEKLWEDISKYLWSPAKMYGFVYRGLAKRENWNFYDGYDDNDTRTEINNLYLEYEDEFENRKKDESESFVPYFESNMEDYYWGYGCDLGRGIPSISYFLKPALYGKGIRIRRPTIVHAETSGLYIDGAGINNSESDYLGSFGENEPQDIKELKEKFLWSKFYQLDPMYYPGVETEETVLGLNNSERYDGENYWYWTLFEYSFDLKFPFGITRGINDKFAYRYNGKVYTGSILPENEDSLYFNWNSTFSSKLKDVFERLFPRTIFKEIDSVDTSNQRYKFTVYSLWNDVNRYFQFVETENNCYSLFQLDTNKRFSCRTKYSSVDSKNHHVLKNYLGKSSGGQSLFEVPIDTGNCVGEPGEINSTEPLFTCDPFHVNKYGCHYKYTKERFAASGKVFVRKYYVKAVYMAESSEPIRDKMDGESAAPAMGYRNYKLKYVGKNSLGEDLFKKEEIPGRIGGIPAVSKLIPVIFEQKEIEEQGWWKAGTDINDPEACISHEYTELDDGSFVYYRLPPKDYAEEIGFQDCYFSEYVDLEEAWEKPFYDIGQFIDRIDKRQPIVQNGEIPQGYIQYVMGAYKPPKSQDFEISPYDNKFVSGVESEEGLNLSRYNQYWNDSGSPRFSEKQGTVVDPLFIEPKGFERSIEKWGYVPDLSLQSYFKKDEQNLWKDRIIPPNNSYVHDLYLENDISFPYRTAVHLFRKIISDINKIELPETEGVKRPLLDFRSKGIMPLEAMPYYSALPQEESPAYASRPPEIYGEDRPLRISGFIDSMSTIVNWKFLYLQTEWNSYNLIHWEGDQDENIYAKLEVAEIDDNGRPGAFMSVKTKDAEWFSKYSCWLIPFEKMKQSDFIDTLNGTFSSVENGIRTQYNFQDGKKYQFRISGLNINSGSYNEPVTSTQFTYSKDAYSPPVITNIEYDKWKREFEIEFRFDDVRGRKYDIINFYYAIYEVGSSSPPDSAFKQLGADILEGTIIDLDSNILGDNVISESYIIKHKVYVSADVLGDIFGKNVRFRLESIASEDREGMTAPVFHFLMWTNEFLQKADQEIARIAGTKNRWVYKSEVNNDGEAEEKWVYLPEEEAVIVPGTLTTQNALISEIESKFEDWYYTVAKFDQPSFDAQYHFVCIENKDGILYNSVFDAFVIQYNMSEQWEEYKLENPGKTESYLKPLFISKNNYSEEFSFYWDNAAHAFISVSEGFSDWFEENRTLSREEVKPMFLGKEEYKEEYQKYLSEQKLTDNDENRTNYIVENSLQGDFDYYYILLNHYPDGRYDDRKKFISERSEEYSLWLNNPKDAYGNIIKSEFLTFEDDSMRLFIAHDRNLWNSMKYANEGKQNAKQYFLSSSVNGVTYGQQLQTANVQIINAQNALNEAYRARNHYESIHRRKLVSKGYFSNGWKNNHPYIGDQKNEIFRFRVENQPSSGSRNKEYEPETGGNSFPETSTPLAGYDTRWEVYFRFQLDFYDSFDSQNGKPLRDYLWQRLDCSGYAGSDVDSIDVDGVKYIRIMGAIEADSGNMHILPTNVYTPESGNTKNSPTTNDPYSFQLAGKFSILKSELPGELDTDIIPENWNTNEPSKNDDFNQLYFWRVCPYNVVERPVWEKESTRIDKIEYFGKSAYYENNYWKISGQNRCFGRAKYSTLAGYYYDDWYGENEAYVWLATKKLNTPVWKTDFNSACWNPDEPYYVNFFHGTDSDRFNIEIENNPIRQSYQDRLELGEIVFLTDRPRELIDDSLNYVQDDTNDHFKSLWVPFNTQRSKPWMFFDEDSKSWLLISQRLSKTQSGYNEYIFTLSRGVSPQTFGEECQLFPGSTMDSVKNVVEDALSFENPCLLKVDSSYVLYFNVRKLNGIYEIWRASSKNLYDWNDFTKISIEERTIFDPAIYKTENGFVMYGVQGSTIVKLNSVDGIEFSFEKTLLSETYSLSRPTALNGKIYLGMSFNGKGKIISIDESIGYESMMLEKGSSIDIENGHQFTAEDEFFNPFVFEDWDKGTRITRIVYEKETNIYAYINKNYQTLNQKEKAFFTEYLEEYSWSKVWWNMWEDDYYNSSIAFPNGNYPVIKDNDGNSVDVFYSRPHVPIGNFEMLVRSNSEPLAVKIPFYQEGQFEEIESEGEWIDFYNISETDAQLSPELESDDYDFSAMTMENFISSENLGSLYSNWLRENYPTPEGSKKEQYQFEFLQSCKQYSVYLKWAYRGPGVYRYLNAVKRTAYAGDGEQK